MRTSVFVALAVVLAGLSGCSSSVDRFGHTAKRQPTPSRVTAAGPLAHRAFSSESSCLRSNAVQLSRFVRPAGQILQGSCGAARPFKVYAADHGRTELSPPATLRCEMVPTVDRWVQTVVAPAAERHLGSPVTSLRVAASYSCRSINSQRGAKLSQHAFANALDISAFILADGRVVTVKRGWNGWGSEAAFLRAVHRGACDHFSTVLGPDADRYHHDHFHFDLARHGRDGTYRVCQ